MQEYALLGISGCRATGISPYFSLAACPDLLNLAKKRLTPDSLKLHPVILFIALIRPRVRKHLVC